MGTGTGLWHVSSKGGQHRRHACEVTTTRATPGVHSQRDRWMVLGCILSHVVRNAFKLEEGKEEGKEVEKRRGGKRSTDNTQRLRVQTK